MRRASEPHVEDWFERQSCRTSLPSSVLSVATVTHPEAKGDVTEAYVAARLLEVGKTVLRPLGDNCRFDLVIYEDGRFLRVRCKTATWDRGYNGEAKGKRTGLIFAAYSSANHTGAKGKKGYRGDADLFGVYFPPLRTVYLVPVDECAPSEIHLRILPPANGQRRGVRFAADYEL
jgi:hypothetical protein